MLSLRERLADVPQVGRLEWIGVRPEHGETMRTLSEVEAIVDRGLQGDIAGRRRGGNRQVTLIQSEHIQVVRALLPNGDVAPDNLRRNLVISGINVLSLVKLRFAIGDVVLLGTGPCAPCGKMDRLLGPGGFQAMRGHGGITAKVERGGLLRLGDRVRVSSEDLEHPA